MYLGRGDSSSNNNKNSNNNNNNNNTHGRCQPRASIRGEVPCWVVHQAGSPAQKKATPIDTDAVVCDQQLQ